MSEKKTPKSKEELAQELEKKQQDKFIEAFRELEKKHGYKIEAQLYFSQQGIIPQMRVVKNTQTVEIPEEKSQ